MPQDRKTVPTKLFVGNISHAADSLALRLEFEKFGTVVECDIIRDYGFVHFEKDEEADTALAALNGKDFLGSKLRVEKSSSFVRHKPGAASSDSKTCYYCGEEGHWARSCPTYSEKDRPPRRGPPPRGYGDDRYDPYRRRHPYDEDPYRRPPPRDPYYDYPPMRDPYYRDRYDPYERYPPLPPRPYAPRDPNRRPPPEYYGAASRYDDPYARPRPRPY